MEMYNIIFLSYVSHIWHRNNFVFDIVESMELEVLIETQTLCLVDYISAT